MDLNAVRWERNAETGRMMPAESYRVLFHISEWSPRRRIGFVNELKRMLAVQRELVNANRAERVHLFFLGEQDAGNPMLFHVRDVRLATFLVVSPEPAT